MTMTTLSRSMTYCQMWRSSSSSHVMTSVSRPRPTLTSSAVAAAVVRVSAVDHTHAPTRRCAVRSSNDIMHCRNAAPRTSRSVDLAYSKSLTMPHSTVTTYKQFLMLKPLSVIPLFTGSVDKMVHPYLQINLDHRISILNEVFIYCIKKFIYWIENSVLNAII